MSFKQNPINKFKSMLYNLLKVNNNITSHKNNKPFVMGRQYKMLVTPNASYLYGKIYGETKDSWKVKYSRANYPQTFYSTIRKNQSITTHD